LLKTSSPSALPPQPPPPLPPLSPPSHVGNHRRQVLRCILLLFRRYHSRSLRCVRPPLPPSPSPGPQVCAHCCSLRALFDDNFQICCFESRNDHTILVPKLCHQIRTLCHRSCLFQFNIQTSFCEWVFSHCTALSRICSK
jgi:hypothetical protein